MRSMSGSWPRADFTPTQAMVDRDFASNPDLDLRDLRHSRPSQGDNESLIVPRPQEWQRWQATGRNSDTDGKVGIIRESASCRSWWGDTWPIPARRPAESRGFLISWTGNTATPLRFCRRSARIDCARGQRDHPLGPVLGVSVQDGSLSQVHFVPGQLAPFEFAV